MSVYTSLSGLNAASTQLGVTSNNLANVSTTGFKSSRADFGDIVAQSAFQTAGTPGLGTALRGMDQQFTQGSFETTGESLNMAISGQGFFVTSTSSSGGAQSLTRDGSFGTNDQGFVVDKTGGYLQGFPVDPSGNVTASGMGGLTALRVPETSGTAAATSAITEAVTLPASADLPASRSAYSGGTAYAFSPNDPDSYNYSSNTTIYDGSGNPLQATTYFVRTSAPSDTDPNSTWQAHLVINGQEAPAADGGNLSFDGSGNLDPTKSKLSFTPAGSTSPLTVDFGTATKQGGTNFALTGVSQNGTAVGSLGGVTVGQDGSVSASYSDGSVRAIGRVAIANVINPGGLTESGDNRWRVTPQSGEPTVAGANSSGMGLIKSGSLEVSNVDVTSELVNLIQAQRNFQANAKAIDTANQLTETAVNLRN